MGIQEEGGLFPPHGSEEGAGDWTDSQKYLEQKTPAALPFVTSETTVLLSHFPSPLGLLNLFRPSSDIRKRRSRVQELYPKWALTE